MAEKTTTTTPKPRKTVTRKKAAAPSNVTEIRVNREPAATTNHEVSREEIARLAHKLWNDRGRQHGHDADDWLRAEEVLRGKAS